MKNGLLTDAERQLLINLILDDVFTENLRLKSIDFEDIVMQIEKCYPGDDGIISHWNSYDAKFSIVSSKLKDTNCLTILKNAENYNEGKEYLLISFTFTSKIIKYF